MNTSSSSGTIVAVVVVVVVVAVVVAVVAVVVAVVGVVAVMPSRRKWLTQKMLSDHFNCNSSNYQQQKIL